MDPVVRLFSPRFLQGRDGEDAPRDSPTQPPSLHPPSFPPVHPFTPPPFPTSPRLSIHLPRWEGIPETLLPLPHCAPSPRSPRASHSVLFHEVNEGRALHLHGLPLPVIHGQHEVEEVGFPEVGGGLLLKMCSCQAHATVEREEQEATGSALRGDPIASGQVVGLARIWL